jgi:hypothetical protein
MVRDQEMITNAEEQIFRDSKRSVTLYRATKETTNISGTESLTYGAAETVDLIFFKTETKFEFDTEGLIEKGDALVFDKPDHINVARNDKIVVDGETFLIKKVVNWYSRGELMYVAATCYLV